MRLFVVSNRLPFTVGFKAGNPHILNSSGGLSTGLSSYLFNGTSPGPIDFAWVGWPGAEVAAEHQEALKQYGQAEFKAAPVFLPQCTIEGHYQGFCNQVLWPLFHYFPSLTRQDQRFWEQYQQANEVFADALCPLLRPDDIVWVHDYHLLLLPELIRRRVASVATGLFLHIPFPCYDMFRVLPKEWRKELLEGMLGANLVGFHTREYTRNFLGCVQRVCGHVHQMGRLSLGDRVTQVDTFPMGVDFEAFDSKARTAETDARASEIRTSCHDLKIVLSIDRLDYTKGLVHRLRGYDLFLRRNPRWHGKVVYVLSVAPSRCGIESYQAMKTELEHAVGQITGTYGTATWSPVVYQYRNVDGDEVVAMYRACDVALITPLRDGMNLVAKEFVASRPDQTGVLILSETAGAAEEMSEAITLNPYNELEIARGLEKALTMPRNEQVKRNRALQDRLRGADVHKWAEDFTEALQATRCQHVAPLARHLKGKAYNLLVHRFASATGRVLLLDYDGTLVPFAPDPALACPDVELIDLLTQLGTTPKNQVAIVSGRSRQDLERWFGNLPVTLIAEHGNCLRLKQRDWRLLTSRSMEWKDQLRPVLQCFTERLPGAWLEEKEFSLAWHYRRSRDELASYHARELLEELGDYAQHKQVQVLSGNKVIEVRAAGATKGTAVAEWLKTLGVEFVLAAGDDQTDEDMFRALPRGGFSVRVGLRETCAGHYLPDHLAVRKLLRCLVNSDGPPSRSHGVDINSNHFVDDCFGK